MDTLPQKKSVVDAAPRAAEKRKSRAGDITPATKEEIEATPAVANNTDGSYKRKRMFSECDGKEESIWDAPMRTSQSWPRYLVVSSEETGRPAKSLSVFKIERALKKNGITNVGSVSQLTSGDLLIEVTTEKDSKRLLKAEFFGDLPVDVEPHMGLNRSRGVVKSSDLDSCTEDELVREIDGVSHARRITVRRAGKEIKTHTWVLTFDTSKPPISLRVAYLTLPVRPFVPNPMRCFNCHRFGHGKDKCRREAVCPRCGKGGHSEEQCSAEASCLNCNGMHSATSKECQKWKEEKAILHYRAQHGGTFSQARAAVMPSLPKNVLGKSFADAVKTFKAVSGVPDDGKKLPVVGNAKPSHSREPKKITTPAFVGGDPGVPTKNRFAVLECEEEMDVISVSSSHSQRRPPNPAPTPPSSLMDVEIHPPPSSPPPRHSHSPSNTYTRH